MKNVTLEPLDDYIVLEPLDESELPSGLIVPANEASQVRSGIVAAVGPDVAAIEPGDKVLFAARRGLRRAPRALLAPSARAAARGSDRAHPRLEA